MNLIIILLVLLLLFGGGGFYFGGPAIGGGGIGLILVICLIIYFMGGFRTKKLRNIVLSCLETDRETEPKIHNENLFHSGSDFQKRTFGNQSNTEWATER
jgi:hypothetical protein